MAIPKKELHENDIQHNPAHNTGEAVFIDCIVYSAFEEMPTTVKIFVLFNYMTIYFCRQLTGQTSGIFPLHQWGEIAKYQYTKSIWTYTDGRWDGKEKGRKPQAG